MTSTSRILELSILGPLEARLDGKPIVLGGAKQRAVLATLLLSAEELVPVDRLIDEVWGEEPPASAAHGLEAYISRLRSLLAPCGPRIVRRGAGYALELDGAVLDARRLDDARAAVAKASADGDDEWTVELASAALALWRGTALCDVALGAGGCAAVERLEERRLVLLEQRAEALLRLGRPEQLTDELRVLVREHPCRERFVALLMLALYRTGRHADALDAYEQTRSALGELGLRPSAELQQLAGRMVRHEPGIGTEPGREPAVAHPVASVGGVRRISRWVASSAALVLAAVLAASGSGSRQVPVGATGDPATTRVAIVLPGAPTASGELWDRYVNGLELAGAVHGVPDGQVFVAGIGFDPALLETRLRRGGFHLVLWAGDGVAAQRFAPRVASLDDMQFVFLDGSLTTLSLRGVANAAAIRFSDEQAAEISGFAGGLMGSRRSWPKRPDLVSVVASVRSPRTERMIDGFERGVRRVAPEAEVLVAYTGGEDDLTECELVANEQLDRGSEVLFVLAGRCGRGALAVAEMRGAWAIDADDQTTLRGNVLMRMWKEYERSVDLAVGSYLDGTLPPGRDISFGIEDDYAVRMELSWDLPVTIDSRVVAFCSSIRRHALANGV